MKFKYPKTLHLPDSPGLQADQCHVNLDQFKNQEIVITEKMDGENTTMYRDHIHARSIDSKYHPSRDWVKGFHGQIKHMIPEGWRVCGENMFAQHSIHYDNLPSYFLGFAIFNERNIMINWNLTLIWFAVLGITPAPILYDGLFDAMQTGIKDWTTCWFPDSKEGYVIRITDSIKFEDFQKYTGKWVRSNHVQTDEHWMHKEIIVNQLKKVDHNIR